MRRLRSSSRSSGDGELGSAPPSVDGADDDATTAGACAGAAAGLEAAASGSDADVILLEPQQLQEQPAHEPPEAAGEAPTVAAGVAGEAGVAGAAGVVGAAGRVSTPWS